jgi:hypothetical protein
VQMSSITAKSITDMRLVVQSNENVARFGQNSD